MDNIVYIIPYREEYNCGSTDLWLPDTETAKQGLSNILANIERRFSIDTEVITVYRVEYVEVEYVWKETDQNKKERFAKPFKYTLGNITSKGKVVSIGISQYTGRFEVWFAFETATIKLDLDSPGVAKFLMDVAKETKISLTVTESPLNVYQSLNDLNSRFQVFVEI